MNRLLSQPKIAYSSRKIPYAVNKRRTGTLLGHKAQRRENAR